MKRIYYGIFLISVMIFFFGCSLANSGSSTKLSVIDISNAKALMVIPSDSINSKKTSNKLVFMKQIDNGNLAVVSMKDENGNSVSRIPTAVYDATITYMIIVVDGIPYLVNKTTGSAYDLSPGGIPEMLRANFGFNGYIRKSIYNDSFGNIYYLNQGIVKKINITNPLKISVESMTPDVYSISSLNEFSVDSNGNIIYSYNDNFVEHWRIKTVEGPILNLDDKNPGLVFTGYDGYIYCSFDGFLNKLEINNGSINHMQLNNISIDGFSMNNGQSLTWIYFNNKIMALSLGGKNVNVYVLYENGVPPSSYTIPFSSSTKYLTVGSQYYYIVTQRMEVIKVDPVNRNCIPLVPFGVYDNIYNITATNDDITIINALRLSDAKKILACISSDGSIDILSENSSTNITILKKVN
ncbi:MAG: hypothetical protein FWF26_00255 [Treponema sp.]|nr:hypothetical protein [Treponema sp.]